MLRAMAPVDLYPEIGAMSRDGLEYSFSRAFSGPDGTTQLKIEYTPNAASEWRVAGGISGGSPVWAAWSETESNVSGTFAAKGSGGFYFGNQAGTLGGIVDNGLGTKTDAYAAFTGGPLNTSGAVVSRSASGLANVGLALVPYGSGALTRTIPDGGTGGGIVRGAYAVDWQAERTFSTSVAQAGRSTIGGGIDNSVSGNGFGGTVSGGSNNILDGEYSWCPGGFLADDRGRIRTGVWSSGMFASRGDKQASEGIFGCVVTDATPTRMTANIAAATTNNVFALPNSATYLLQVLLSARQTAGSAGTTGDSSWKVVAFALKRGANAATTALVGSATTLASGSDAGASTWSWSVGADTTNGGVSITFTGEANKTIRSVARLMCIEVVG